MLLLCKPRQVLYVLCGGPVRTGLCISLCSSDYIFSRFTGVSRIVSEDSPQNGGVFPADYLHPIHYHDFAS